MEVILKKSELSWLYNYDVDIAKQAVKDACDSYIKFFKRKSGFPRFKSKKYSKKSFFVDNIKIKITDNGVKIPKLKTIIKFAEKYYIPLNVLLVHGIYHDSYILRAFLILQSLDLGMPTLYRLQ